MKSRGSIWHFVKHALPGLDVRSFCFRGNYNEAQSAIHIIRNQTPDLAGRRKWKRKASIHCLVIKSHFIRPRLLPCTSFLTIDELLSAKWAQSDSKYMRHTYLTFSAKREKQVNKTGMKLSNKIAHYLFTNSFIFFNGSFLCVQMLPVIASSSSSSSFSSDDYYYFISLCQMYRLVCCVYWLMSQSQHRLLSL